MTNAVKTLLLPFETGDLDWPAADRNYGFLNAVDPGPAVASGIAEALACEQGFRPEYLRLKNAAYAVVPELEAPPGSLSGCLVLAGKHKGENHAMIARAARLTKPGGVIAIAGDKNLGIASLRKWAGEHVTLNGSLAKHHATVFWFENPTDADFGDTNAEALQLDQRFETAPGMFSPRRADPGSVLLAEQFDKRIVGEVADFGCGWGYLSAQVLRCSDPSHIALFDAHHPSLRAAERNLAPLADTVPVASHWHDLVSEPVARQFDWIVMNPPFHSGRAAEPDIGKAFIAAASRALKPGGRLLMVANRKLPYEQPLTAGFRKVRQIAAGDGFKIFEAMR